MSYSDDNIMAQPAVAEYSARSRRRAADEEQLEVQPRSRRGTAVPVPADAQEVRAEATPEDQAAEPAPRRARIEVQQQESAPRRRAATPQDDEQPDEQLRPVRRRRVEPEQAGDDAPADEYNFDNESDKPRRNRIMAWLESMRIIEEIPQEEQEAEQEPAPRPVRKKKARPNSKAPAKTRRNAPPEPVQDEPQAEQQDEPAPQSAPAGRPRSERPARSMRVQREAKPAGDEHKRSVPLPTGRQRRGDAEQYYPYAEEEAPQSASDVQTGPAPETGVVEVEFVAVNDVAPAADDVLTEEAVADEAVPQDAPAVYADEDEQPVSRRARRRAAPAAPQTAETVPQPAPEVQTEEPVDDLEQRYVNADLVGKRAILFDHWKEQFGSRMLTSSRDEQLRSITDMVRRILDACPDELALYERWEKIEVLLPLSSAVVAEHRYKSLLATVEAEEQQRRYGRPAAEPVQRIAPQPPKLVKTQSAAPAASSWANAVDEPADEPELEPVQEAQPEYVDDGYEYEQRPARRRGGEFDYEPEERRENVFDRVLARVKALGRRDENDDNVLERSPDRPGRLGGLRFGKLLRRGDVLDYSSDEPEYTGDDYDEYDAAEEEASDYAADEPAYDDTEDGGYGDYADDVDAQYGDEPQDDYFDAVDRSIYEEGSDDYSPDRPDYDRDYAEGFERRGGYSDGGYGRADGYMRASSLQYDKHDRMQYARPDAINRPQQREYGERAYYTRPQGGSAVMADEDADEGRRRCSPTKDDRDGMGASHRDTNDAAGRARLKGGALLGMLLCTAYAEGDEQEDDPPPAVRRADPRRVRLGRRFAGDRRAWLSTLGTIALIAVAGAVAYGARVVYDVQQYSGAFYEGVYLDGMELTGMTMEQARDAVNAANADRVQAMSLSVKYGEEIFDIDSAALGVQLDTDAQLAELWQLGRTGGYAARHAQISQLREAGVQGHTTLSYSRDALDGFITGIKAAVDRQPRDAEIRFQPNESDKFAITESRPGREVDLTALTADAQTALGQGGGAVELAPRTLEPDFTTEDARACTGRLVTYSTTISSSNSSRTANIKLALGFYHGLRVEPGEQVDFNELVGNRTTARGFKAAPEYSNGEIVEGVGGGVCQASTTLYGALLRAGMQIDERHNHSMTVGYVPRSQDAAVVYPGKSLTFTNTSGYPVFFTTRVTADKATVTIYGYDMYPGQSISVESEILSTDRAKVSVYPDPTYQYTSEPGQEVTITTPSDGVTSRAYLVITDDETGKVVSRTSLGKDTYRRRDGVKYRGGE